ncbi:MAG TPA: 50S ribosomal protein L11 methyltransferase [Cyclobacteriaceae bacterium]|nr:50S ribosomal protein L11 methyltransferase [Cyclobacteriaceae bacterium]
MASRYISVEVKCEPANSEMLIAELSLLGYDSFLEDDSGFQAGISEADFNIREIESIIERYREFFPVSFSYHRLRNENWNKLWERNFPYVVIEDRVLIKASFHKIRESYPFEIIINPKMSFGTGHHESTYLMVKAMLGLDMKGKAVLDAGCGTGILSILAEKMGARTITAIDIDENAVSNANENIRINGCSKISVATATAGDLGTSSVKPDVLLANINRNVLLNEVPAYAGLISPGGTVVLGGFFSDDIPLLEKSCGDHGFTRVASYARNNWSVLVFHEKSEYFSTKYQ